MSVPLRYPTASIFIDESGARASNNDFFVLAAVKVREPGRLARELLAVREKCGFGGEFKFAEINRSSIPVYGEIIRVLHESDATTAACVVSGSVHNPFRGREDQWRVHAEITSQLLVGCINRRELVGVHLDGLSTPVGESLEETVRNLTNARLKNTSVVSAVALDSKTNDILQVADMVAGAIRHERMLSLAPRSTRSNKGKIALKLATAFERPELTDGRDARLNIATYRGRAAQKPRLRAVASGKLSGRRRAG
ncbi:DUF3800 domain-containing protein [Pseudonocardia alni]|uniref:DUF3800 domain-containing protein n=1 Tax=Pseudonocardia alni TaxID=33907 RepID=UPI00280BE2C6|nr:DUF3800 domain-containing protein [Pseudonocardia alni]